MAQKKLEAEIRIKGKADSSLDSIASTLRGVAQLVNGISTEAQKIIEGSLDVWKIYQRNMLDARGALSAQYDSYTELEQVMGDLDEQAQNWSASSIFHTSDVSKAISEAAHAGWNYSEMVSGIPAAMQLAQAGGYELSAALDQVIKVTNASGTEFENVGGMIDMWTLAANKGATTIEEMGEALTRMGSTVQFAGGMDQTFTMLTLLANMGTVGTEAGTLLRNTMLRLVAPTDKAAAAMEDLMVTEDEAAELSGDAEALAEANKQLEQYGFSVYNEKGELKDMTTIFSDLSNAVDGMTDQQRNTLLSAIFPTRTITGAMNLLKSIKSGDWTEILSQMAEAKGYAEEVAGIQNTGYGNQIELFTSKIEELERKIGSIVAPNIESIMSSVGGVLDSLNSADPVVMAAISGVLEGLAAIGPVTAGVSGVAILIAKIASSPYAAIFATAAAVTALAAGVGALYEIGKIKWSEQFGDATVDAQAIQKYLDTLVTPFSSNRDKIKTAAEDVEAAKQSYITNLTQLTGLFMTDAIIANGGELDPEHKEKYMAYGKAIYDSLVEGIDASKKEHLLSINSFWDSNNDGTIDNPDDYDLYSSLVDAEVSFWSNMETQVTTAIENYYAAVEAAATQGWNDETKKALAEAKQQLIDAQREIAEFNSDSATYEALLSAGTVSWDSIQETLALIETARQQELEAQKSSYKINMSAGRQAWMDANGGQYISAADFASTPEGQRITSQYQDEVVTAVNSYWADQISRTYAQLLTGTGYEQAFDFMRFVTQEGGPKYYTVADLAAMGVDDPQGYMDAYMASHNGRAPLQMAYYANQGYNLYDQDASGNGLYKSILALTYASDDISESLKESGAVDFAALTTVLYDAQQAALNDRTLVTNPTIFGNTNTTNPSQTSFGTGTTGSTTVSGSTGQTTATTGTAQNKWMNGLSSQANAVNAVSGASALIVHANTQPAITDVAKAVSDIEAKTATINVRANVSSTGGLTSYVNRYATGGRATTASIFGEAGAEWAIPEEHSSRTADLLDSARRASGFTWGELLSRTGGLNSKASSSGSTFVFSPTINANDTTGVEDVLARSGEAMKRWWKRMNTKESMEVYA